jgi:hypothetical protein
LGFGSGDGDCRLGAIFDPDTPADRKQRAQRADDGRAVFLDDVALGGEVVEKCEQCIANELPDDIEKSLRC